VSTAGQGDRVFVTELKTEAVVRKIYEDGDLGLVFADGDEGIYSQHEITLAISS